VKLPRWTTYPALASLFAMALVAIPRPTEPASEKASPEAYGASVRAALAEPSVAVPPAPAEHRKVVVLGIDGLDPDILREVVERFPERMPNFRRLIAEGDGVQPLATSTPPQSPVAWSNFISGRDPGGHGIFDFIHRDPVTRGLLGSTTKALPASGFARLVGGDDGSLGLPGKYQFPLGGESESNRSGRSFWQALSEHGVPADIWRMPANFPVEPAKGLSFPGMMTPALDSAYGEYTFYTTDPPTTTSGSGGKIETVRADDGLIYTSLFGPENAFVESGERAKAPLRILVDYESRSALLEFGLEKILIEEGEWSTFKPVTFDMLPMSLMPMGGIVRFYLRSVEPEFELYASPINFDPTAPATPVSEPQDASADLADRTHGIGLYYTQGMAEEVSGVKNDVLTIPEFLEQADLVYEERLRMMDYALDHYLESGEGGLLFFYYSTIDLTNHMVWALFDPEHPFHSKYAHLAPQDSSAWSGRPGSKWGEVVWDLYMKMDPVLGRLRERIGEDATVIVMSDHGFAPYRRTFSLNTWLYEEGYLVLRDGLEKELPREHPDHHPIQLTGTYDHDEDPETPEISMVDWERTRAYGVGFNGLYLNLKGREGCDHDGEPVEGAAPGSVDESERRDLARELKEKLERITDPDNGGKRVVVRADLAWEVYGEDGERLDEAPDVLVGYNTDYENSEDSTQGSIPHDVLEDNLGGSFVGSHLMAPEMVPGTLLANRPLRDGQHALEDLTVEILAQYGIDPVEGMVGHRVLADTTP